MSSHASFTETTSVRETYRSTKSYDHSEGLSCTFRQWRAIDSHCHFLHGYALAFRFVFITSQLDERNWCYDFGALKPLRTWLHDNFDHTLIVAEDDPKLDFLLALGENGLARVLPMPAVGCESFARFAYEFASDFVRRTTHERVYLESVEVSEHSGNSAIFTPGTIAT